MKIKFGILGFKKLTPSKLKKISAFAETVFATVGGSTLMAGYPNRAAIFLILAGITNKFFEMFYEEDNSTDSGNNAA